MDFSYYIMDEEVYADMKMTFQPKKRQRAKVHGFRARMTAQVEEKFWLPESKR